MLKSARFLFLISLALFHFGHSQESIELGHLFDPDIETWYDISFRCSELVAYFYEKNEPDSVTYILQYWEEETGVMEPVRRAWMLNQIARNTFTADFLGDAVIEDLMDYKQGVETQKSDTSHWIVPGYKKTTKTPYYVSADFNRFTKSLANELLKYTDLSDDEYLICLFYSHQFDEFFRLFKSGEARYTTLYRLVVNYKKTAEKFDIHYGLFLGYWTPRKTFALFGEKVNIGGTFGAEWQRVVVDFCMLLQFPDSQNPYTVKYEDELFETRHYFRFYLGLEPAFKLYDWGQVRLDLLAGAGIDVLEAVSQENNPYYEESISLAGPNFNLGVGLQHFIKKGQPYYLYYQLRYEFASYDSDGGTDLSEGEALSLRVGLAWDANVRKHQFKKYFH